MSFIYDRSIAHLSSEDLKFLSTLSALFYVDHPIDSLYCIEYFNWLQTRKEERRLGLQTKQVAPRKEEVRGTLPEDIRCCFQFGRFKFAWIGKSNQKLQLFCCRRQASSKIPTFYESMLHKIVSTLNVIELDSDQLDDQHPPFLFKRQSPNYDIGVLVIGNAFANRKYPDGFVHLHIERTIFYSLKEEPCLPNSAVIFVDSKQIDPIFLLRNDCQPEILVISGREWDDSKMLNLLRSRSKVTVILDDVDQVSHEFIELVGRSVRFARFFERLVPNFR